MVPFVYRREVEINQHHESSPKHNELIQEDKPMNGSFLRSELRLSRSFHLIDKRFILCLPGVGSSPICIWAANVIACLSREYGLRNTTTWSLGVEALATTTAFSSNSENNERITHRKPKLGRGLESSFGIEYWALFAISINHWFH